MAKRKKPGKPQPPPEPEFDPLSNASYVRSHGRRPPSWRWDTIVGKLQTQSSDLLVEKEIYEQAVRFHSLLNEANTQQLARQYPNMYEAWAISTQEEDFRWYMEGMITARHEQQHIADELELELQTVKIYEYLFYDVRSHKSNFYFLTHCLGGAARGVVDKSNLDTTLKLLALHGGIAVLKDFVSLGLSPSDVVQFYQDTTRSQQRKNVLMSELGRTVNRFTERHISEQDIERQKLELIARQAGLLDGAGKDTGLGGEGLEGMGMTIAAFTQELVARTGENEPRALVQALIALNGSNMKPVDPVSPPSASQEVSTTPTQEPSRETDGPKD